MPSVYQPEQANSSGAQIPHGTIEGTVALSDQNRNTIFLNVLSSPIRGSLQQPFHMAHGGNSSNSRGSSNEDSPSRGTGVRLIDVELHEREWSVFLSSGLRLSMKKGSHIFIYTAEIIM
ncbi:hypothetical protein QJS10_CPB15g00052 [Acorus calamus]|uniref:Uncharacterized protein n=1 Tax=Acorus calamus TaxID=4465 RepID=A0AAV9D670_ACOCL|nr:hypothetical protein QJS10_CPB15g00052 [Acorus calamus]